MNLFRNIKGQMASFCPPAGKAGMTLKGKMWNFPEGVSSVASYEKILEIDSTAPGRGLSLIHI